LRDTIYVLSGDTKSEPIRHFQYSGIIEKLSGGHIQGIIDISWNKETFSYSMQHGIPNTGCGTGEHALFFSGVGI
jgi:hypothetical protein